MTFESYELNNAAEENHARIEARREHEFACGDEFLAAQEAERDEEFEREWLTRAAALMLEAAAIDRAVTRMKKTASPAYAALLGWSDAVCFGGKAVA